MSTILGPPDSAQCTAARPVVLSPRPPLLARLRPALGEILLLVTLYLGYTASRLLASNDIEAATANARAILELESALGLDVEAPLNAWLLQVPGAEVASSYWYALLHYLVTPMVLVLLWRRGREAYRPARTALALATGVALVGYILLPTTPPRLMAGYTDVLAATATYGWWGAEASAPRGLGGATNQLAAMPSMHVGWALWVAVVLAGLARHRWQRVAAYSYLAGTSVVVVVTANHWVLDGVVGAVVMSGALTVAGVTPRVARAGRRALQGCLPSGCSS